MKKLPQSLVPRDSSLSEGAERTPQTASLGHHFLIHIAGRIAVPSRFSAV